MKTVGNSITKKLEKLQGEVEELMDMLQEAADKAEEYFNGRSEKWQETNSHYSDFVDGINTAREQVEAALDAINEVELPDPFEAE